jgi:type II secretory pathway component GspD/PulD (secretin)
MALLLVFSLLGVGSPSSELVADSYRTEVIFLRGLPAERAILLHERLLGSSGESTIVPGRQDNVIVVRDTPARLARFHQLLAVLDSRGAAERHIYVRPVRYLAASELAQLTDDIIGGRQDMEEVRMVADDRSQQLVVMCRKDTYRTLDRLFRKLDVADDGRNKRAIRVTPAPAGTRPGEFPP